jgi:hypothetical protein
VVSTEEVISPYITEHKIMGHNGVVFGCMKSTVQLISRHKHGICLEKTHKSLLFFMSRLKTGTSPNIKQHF